MTTADSSYVGDFGHGNGQHDAHHDPHLAHHFDNREQQFQSAKLGMWVFLGTEILMFGGLFCAYSVYRHNHPDVFAFAHQFLNRTLGAVNTLVLITSSLTMAWGVRAAQLGNQKSLRWLLAVTLIGGYGFLGIKAIEYHTKWHHHIWFGSDKHNVYYKWNGETKINEPKESEEVAAIDEGSQETLAPAHAAGVIAAPSEAAATPAAPAKPAEVAPAELPPGAAVDANAGSSDEAKIAPNWAAPKGLSQNIGAQEQERHLTSADLATTERQRIYTFFGVYFFMTGLHGVHVVIGMSLIYWVLLRAVGPRGRLWLIPAAPVSLGLFFCYLGILMGDMRTLVAGTAVAIVFALWAVWRTRRTHRVADPPPEFGPDYFTPVDLVGLYWHIVDIIWIFLFPMLYLIH
jgi:cytochrome c oxidase subunit III